MDSFRNKLKSNLWTLGACDKLLAQKWNVDEVLLLQEKSTFNADAICETKRWSQPPLELNGYDWLFTHHSTSTLMRSRVQMKATASARWKHSLLWTGIFPNGSSCQFHFRFSDLPPKKPSLMVLHQRTFAPYFHSMGLRMIRHSKPQPLLEIHRIPSSSPLFSLDYKFQRRGSRLGMK